MTNLILCGGIGSRLWPLSRTHLPKQFARILPGDSLFEATVKRNLPFCEKLLTASNHEQSFLVANQLHTLGINSWLSLIEPVSRNTAPAIALACMALPADELVLVCPSDHCITDLESYGHSLQRAKELAQLNKLVCFGIKATYPETGYGYIETDPLDIEKVLSYKEKPDYVTAELYFKSGRHFWNSGMFCFKAGVFLRELKLLSNELWQLCALAYQGAQQGSAIGPSLERMKAIPSISVDYAVMEKSSNTAVVPCDMGWSDLGSYDALYDYLSAQADSQGNVFSGNSNTVICNSQRNLVLNGGRTVALLGVCDLLVVESPDAILISKRGESQNVKQLVDGLKERQSTIVDHFPRVERAWGNHLVLFEEAGYRIKRVEVAAAHRGSLHRHRSHQEHWTVVHGTARIQVGSDWHTVACGTSISIPIMMEHRIDNPGPEILILTEIQIGTILKDDDIERLEDDFQAMGD